MSDSNLKVTNSNSSAIKNDNKANTSKRMRVLAISSALFSLIGSAFLIMGPFVHEVFGIASPIFFIIAIILLVKTQQGRISRSTQYATASICIVFLGFVFLMLGLHIHYVFTYSAPLVYFCAAFFIGIISIAIIVGSGEIIKVSGIIKLAVLFIIVCGIARCTVVSLEKLRNKSNVEHISRPKTKAPANSANCSP